MACYRIVIISSLQVDDTHSISNDWIAEENKGFHGWWFLVKASKAQCTKHLRMRAQSLARDFKSIFNYLLSKSIVVPIRTRCLAFVIFFKIPDYNEHLLLQCFANILLIMESMRIINTVFQICKNTTSNRSVREIFLIYLPQTPRNEHLLYYNIHMNIILIVFYYFAYK